jgi:hypothetical protein
MTPGINRNKGKMVVIGATELGAWDYDKIKGKFAGFRKQ